MLLNTRLPAALEELWPRAEQRIAADGAVNRLRRQFPGLTPDLVVGDLDSADPAILDELRRQGVEVRDLSDDQDSTDLDKALRAATPPLAVVVGELCSGGRLDHFFGAVNSLARLGGGRHALCLAQSAAMAVLEGGVRHVLPAHGLAGRPCGLVPVDGPCRATTSGLRWDVEDAELRFGALVSTSNEVAGAEVEVFATGPLLWTLTLGEE